mgnify:CR=1 FL=1
MSQKKKKTTKRGEKKYRHKSSATFETAPVESRDASICGHLSSGPAQLPVDFSRSTKNRRKFVSNSITTISRLPLSERMILSQKDLANFAAFRRSARFVSPRRKIGASRGTNISAKKYSAERFAWYFLKNNEELFIRCIRRARWKKSLLRLTVWRWLISSFAREIILIHHRWKDSVSVDDHGCLEHIFHHYVIPQFQELVSLSWLRNLRQQNKRMKIVSNLVQINQIFHLITEFDTFLKTKYPWEREIIIYNQIRNSNSQNSIIFWIIKYITYNRHFRRVMLVKIPTVKRNHF